MTTSRAFLSAAAAATMSASSVDVIRFALCIVQIGAVHAAVAAIIAATASGTRPASDWPPAQRSRTSEALMFGESTVSSVVVDGANPSLCNSSASSGGGPVRLTTTKCSRASRSAARCQAGIVRAASAPTSTARSSVGYSRRNASMVSAVYETPPMRTARSQTWVFGTSSTATRRRASRCSGGAARSSRIGATADGTNQTSSAPVRSRACAAIERWPL